jgi:hypothetical protein
MTTMTKALDRALYRAMAVGPLPLVTIRHIYLMVLAGRGGTY